MMSFKKYISCAVFTITTTLVGFTSSAAADSVFVASNQPDGNIILSYDLSRSGRLRAKGQYPTGGVGTGTGLGNAGGLSLGNKRKNARWLAAVNAGSNDVSLFRIRKHLLFASKATSGGVRPVSVDYYNNILYVLNAGNDSNPSNVSGFRISPQGALSPIPNSTMPLSDGAVGPAQIAFAPDGRHLAVTEKATNIITVFAVDRNSGLLSNPVNNVSNGQTPFGFQWTRNNTLVVSEAFGGQSSALSEYSVNGNATLNTLSGSVTAGSEQAACWVDLTPNERFAFITNTRTSTISSYSRTPNGSLSLINAQALQTKANPIDFAINNSGQLGVVLNASDSLQSFRVNKRTGALTVVDFATGIPDGTNGLVINRR